MIPEDIQNELDFLSYPGSTILETLHFTRQTLNEFQERMGESNDVIFGLICGQRHMTPQLALKLEKWSGIDSQFWINREMLYRQKLVMIHKKIKEG